MAKLGGNSASSRGYEKIHHIPKQVEKRQSFHPQVAEDIAENFDLEQNEYLLHLLKRLCKRGERLTLEELIILRNYFNDKYASHLADARTRNKIIGEYPLYPVVDLIMFLINKRYTEFKELENIPLVSEQTEELPKEKEYLDEPNKPEQPKDFLDIWREEHQVVLGLSPETPERNRVADIQQSFEKSQKLAHYPSGSEDEMIEKLLLISGDLSGIEPNAFLTMRTKILSGIGRTVGIPPIDLARIERLLSKLNGTAAVIKNTTLKVKELKKANKDNNVPVDSYIDVPLRFLLTKYKPHKKELFSLFSHCQQRRKFMPGKEIREYIQHAKMPIHPAHIRMLERVINFKATRDLRYTYIYFDMDKYEYRGGLDEQLAKYSHIQNNEALLEADQIIAYFRDRVSHMNRRYGKEIAQEKKDALHREGVFEQLKSPRCVELKEYGLLPTDIEAYYRLIDKLPIVDLSYLETYLEGFRKYAFTQSAQVAAQKATEILDKTYNMRLDENEQNDWVSFGLSLRPAKETEVVTK